MKNQIDKVVFRKFKDGQIIALFKDTIKDGMVLSYMSTGQHVNASIDIVKATKLANPSEFIQLKRELRKIGYNPKTYKRL